MQLDVERAASAVDAIARRLKITRVAAAEGIVRVANANMERAIRLVSVERGHDPRDFALVAFGGCGGLHACEIARELGIRTVLVPEYAGALSALGMLLANQVRDYAAGVLNRPDIEREFQRAVAHARHVRRDRARREEVGKTPLDENPRARIGVVAARKVDVSTPMRVAAATQAANFVMRRLGSG